ncbi:HD domain-containing phosphohydrolase [Desulfoluna butyratoxydans]|uniref:Signal transduction response regulator receiver domain n=1 Tax=Desulfoluna butyratoxydans TaxID=231438 RepID=A0A4U8YPZ9_9BACT|nr:HD domain-containing phosphohydrolase [Desulfoluna butyratoxydans]VFQ45517.1 signal transduction response regulator receiver domain [Desulfoluna butyratoxydans]
MTEHANRRILLVDDTKANIDILVQALREDYKLGVALGGEKAIEYAHANPLDLILLDILMPGMDGFEVCSRLKESPATRDIPIIFITAMDDPAHKRKGLSIGAVDYITKPFDISEVRARVKTHLTLKVTQESLKNKNLILEEKVRQRTRELKETQVEIVNRLSLASKFRDCGTGQNVLRISKLAEMLGSRAGLSEEETERLALSSTLHDAGKIGIPDEILMKKGKLTDTEWEQMKGHTTIGARLLAGSNSPLMQDARTIALTHHERWDGTGYNQGIKGEEIPLIGRIVAICDVFDALISERPHKAPWPVEKAFREIQACSGSHFDPRLVELFMEMREAVVDLIAKND